MIKNIDRFRLIITDCLSARENMAIDEAILSHFEKDMLPILRLYCWEKGSMTIGASQKISEYQYLENKKIAKRVTGGGVLFHGHDISYSLILSAQSINHLDVKKSYEYICRFVFNFYSKLRLNPVYAKDDTAIVLSNDAYCQIGFEAYDILVNGKKIGGNAQRRTRKAIFQHGSIPILKTKKDAKIGYSLPDVGIGLSLEMAVELLSQSFRDTFNATLEHSSLTQEEEKTKKLLLKGKYHYENSSEN